MKMKIRTQHGECKSGGENLRIRRRREKSIGIHLVKGFPAVAVCHQYAPKRLLRMSISERGINSCPKSHHVWSFCGWFFLRPSSLWGRRQILRFGERPENAECNQ